MLKEAGVPALELTFGVESAPSGVETIASGVPSGAEKTSSVDSNSLCQKPALKSVWGLDFATILQCDGAGW